jgi:hypothetical protein
MGALSPPGLDAVVPGGSVTVGIGETKYVGDTAVGADPVKGNGE